MLPVVRELARQTTIPISVDTSKAEVARQCLSAGASIVNDVTALTGDPQMPAVVKEFHAAAIVMHMRGTPQTMQINPHYDDVVAEIYQYLETRLRDLEEFGLSREQLAIDSGIGFGQTHEHSFAVLKELHRFKSIGRPLCLGVSRKGFIGKITGRPVTERQAGSVAVACLTMASGTHLPRPRRRAHAEWCGFRRARPVLVRQRAESLTRSHERSPARRHSHWSAVSVLTVRFEEILMRSNGGPCHTHEAKS